MEEDFAPERVIVDLSSGRYHCLNESGALFWAAVASEPKSLTRICQELSLHFALDGVAAMRDIEAFSLQLEEANLVAIERSAIPEVSSVHGDDGAPSEAPWLTPTCTSYSELESLLLIDPVHEVEEALGWPQAKTENK